MVFSTTTRDDSCNVLHRVLIYKRENLLVESSRIWIKMLLMCQKSLLLLVHFDVGLGRDIREEETGGRGAELESRTGKKGVRRKRFAQTDLIFLRRISPLHETLSKHVNEYFSSGFSLFLHHWRRSIRVKKKNLSFNLYYFQLTPTSLFLQIRRHTHVLNGYSLFEFVWRLLYQQSCFNRVQSSPILTLWSFIISFSPRLTLTLTLSFSVL